MSSPFSLWVCHMLFRWFESETGLSPKALDFFSGRLLRQISQARHHLDAIFDIVYFLNNLDKAGCFFNSRAKGPNLQKKTSRWIEGQTNQRRKSINYFSKWELKSLDSPIGSPIPSLYAYDALPTPIQSSVLFISKSTVILICVMFILMEVCLLYSIFKNCFNKTLCFLKPLNFEILL